MAFAKCRYVGEFVCAEKFKTIIEARFEVMAAEAAFVLGKIHHNFVEHFPPTLISLPEKFARKQYGVENFLEAMRCGSIRAMHKKQWAP